MHKQIVYLEQGEKRQKDPKRLSEASYPTKRKRCKLDVIDFDPMPDKYRRISKENYNQFVCNLQRISMNEENVSMWETQLYLSYKDYKLSNIDLIDLQLKIEMLSSNLTPPSLMQLHGTEDQSQSDQWYSERWPGSTASTCQRAYNIGKRGSQWG